MRSSARSKFTWNLKWVAALVVVAAVWPIAPAQQAPPDQPARLGVVGFYNPRLMYLKYQPLADFLTRYSDRQWKLQISTTYDETVEQLCSGELDLAYLGPFTYVRAHEACGAEPVVRLNTAGRSHYRSYVMVAANSSVTSIEQLRGKRFGYGAPLSSSSHVEPRLLLLGAGLEGGEDYECIYYGHHDRAARAALMGDVDACAVRDIIGEKFLDRGLRILATSEPIPNFPLVAGPGISPEFRQSILDALVYLPEASPKIASEIAAWDEELAAGFVPCLDREYDVVRDHVKKVLGQDALTRPLKSIECAGGRP